MLVKKIQRYLDLLIDRYPQLLNCKEDIEKAYLILEECYENDHKLLIAGNGSLRWDFDINFVCALRRCGAWISSIAN